MQIFKTVHRMICDGFKIYRFVKQIFQTKNTLRVNEPNLAEPFLMVKMNIDC